MASKTRSQSQPLRLRVSASSEVDDSAAGKLPDTLLARTRLFGGSGVLDAVSAVFSVLVSAESTEEGMGGASCSLIDDVKAFGSKGNLVVRSATRLPRFKNSRARQVSSTRLVPG